MGFLKSILGGGGNNSLSASEAITRIDSGDSFFILDVRQPDEYRMGHIDGAKLIPLGELNKRLNEIPKDRDILCVCASGSRSGAATQQLLGAGYKAINMRGGMAGWQMAGKPIKKGK